MVNITRPLGCCLGLLLISSAVGIQAQPVAYAQTSPANGNVYVLSNGEWQAAFVVGIVERISQGVSSWSYTVRYPNGETESQISADRVRTIQQAQAEGLTNDVYDLSTQAGVAQILSVHNDLRQQVGVDDLRWSTTLATSAQAWADTLIAQNLIGHSPAASQGNADDIGENITQYQTTTGGAYRTPAQAVQGWVNEAQDYDYETNRCTAGKECGHYTQMVWANTTEVGCAVARNANETREVWVCHYDPVGNFTGQRPY
ncbi:MAG: CAP domain-containing protein [Cyanobacteria bacterium P01_H01_bin.21]